MTKKAKNPVKIQRSEIVYYRMLIVLAALIAVIFSINYLTNTTAKYNEFLLNTAPDIAMVLGIICIPALIFFIVCRVLGKNETHRVLSSGFLFSVVLWLTSVFAFYGRLSSKTIMAYIVVTAALYFVYYLFNRQFFVYSLYTALGAGILLMIHSSTRVEHIIAALLALIVTAIAVYLVVRGRNGGVEMRIGKFVLKISDKGFEALPFIVSAALLVLGTALSFFFANMAFYALVALFASYLVFTIVNTVKMM